jgi:hypothetical protein
LKSKGSIIIVVTIAFALLVSAGIAVAAGVSSSNQKGVYAEGETPQGVKASNQTRLQNQGADTEVCNGECNGDCDRDQLRLQDGTCDGECDGDGTQTQSRWGDKSSEEAVSLQGYGSGQNGVCAGDCDRDQDRLQDGSCGSCDGDCDQMQKQQRGS